MSGYCLSNYRKNLILNRWNVNLKLWATHQVQLGAYPKIKLVWITFFQIFDRKWNRVTIFPICSKYTTPLRFLQNSIYSVAPTDFKFGSLERKVRVFEIKINYYCRDVGQHWTDYYTVCRNNYSLLTWNI